MQLRLAQYSRLAADDGVVAVWGTIQRDPDMMSDADTENYGSYMVYDIDTLKYEDVDGVYYYSIMTGMRMESADQIMVMTIC